MTQPLTPCASCQRHVRADSDACPFCLAAREPTVVRERPPSPRVSRAVAFAFGATLGVGCAPSVAAYGVPAPPLDGAVQDAPDDGADASADAGVDATADLGVRYGAPPPPDGG